MASNGSSPRAGDTESSLEKIKRQLTSGSGRNLLQGPLLKRSETLRKWNERWVILDPTTGKMEYKARRNEPAMKGTIIFDANSTITLSPVNFHGLPKYDGCCFYIGTPQKKDYFLCAETPGAARAWETLRVKDEELQQLAKELRAMDSTIKEIAEKLTETAEAAESAASAAHTMDEERRLACAEIERLTVDTEKQLESSRFKLKESEEKVLSLSKEKETLLKQRDSALREAHLWRSELAKAREHAVVLEAAVLRAEERARVSEAEAEARAKDAAEKALAAAKDKEELLGVVNMLQSQVQRQQSSTKQVFEERSESCSGTTDTKHVDSEDDVDKACLSDSKTVPVSADSEVQVAVDGVEIHSIGEAEWTDFQSTDARIADVREISPETEGNSLDINVVNPRVEAHQHGDNSLQP